MVVKIAGELATTFFCHFGPLCVFVVAQTFSSGAKIIRVERRVCVLGLIRHSAEEGAETLYLSKRRGALSDMDVCFCG